MTNFTVIKSLVCAYVYVYVYVYVCMCVCVCVYSLKCITSITSCLYVVYITLQYAGNFAIPITVYDNKVFLFPR